MPESSRDAQPDDRAAELNEQIAEGHEWAADEELGGSGNLHSAAARKYRRVAGKDRSKAESAGGAEDS